MYEQVLENADISMNIPDGIWSSKSWECNVALCFAYIVIPKSLFDCCLCAIDKKLNVPQLLLIVNMYECGV